jgi:hypothetical protein
MRITQTDGGVRAQILQQQSKQCQPLFIAPKQPAAYHLESLWRQGVSAQRFLPAPRSAFASNIPIGVRRLVHIDDDAIVRTQASREAFSM